MADPLVLEIVVDDKGTPQVKGFTQTVEQGGKRIQTSAERTGNKVTAAFSKIPQVFGTVAKGIGLAATALTGIGAGLFAMTKNVADSQAQVEEFGRRIGVSTEFLSEMAFAAEQEGIANQALNTSLQRLQRRLGEAADGTGIAVNAFQKLGIKLTDTTGKVRPLEKVFPEVAEALSKVEDPSKRAALAMKLMDTEGVKLLQIMDKGADGLQAYSDRAQELGIVVTESAAKSSKEFAGNLTDLQKSFSGVVRLLANELIPIFVPLLKGLTDSILEWRTSGKAAAFFGETVVGSLELAVSAIRFLGRTWQAVNRVFSDVTGFILLGFEKILSGLGFILEKAGQAAKFLGLEGVASKLEGASKAVKGFRDTVGLMSDAAFEVADDWEQSGGEVTRAIDTVADQVHEQAEAIKAPLVQAATDVATAFTITAKEAQRQTRETLENNAKVFAAIAEKATDTSATVIEVGTRAHAAWAKAARAANQEIIVLLDDVAVKGELVSKRMLVASQAWATDVIGIKNQIDEQLANLKTATRGDPQGFKGFAENLRGTSQRALDQLVRRLAGTDANELARILPSIRGSLAPETQRFLNHEGFQDGGVVTKPTVALLGENPAKNPEFILNREQMEALTQGGGGGTTTVHAPVTVHINGEVRDADAVVQRIGPALEEAVRIGRIKL